VGGETEDRVQEVPPRDGGGEGRRRRRRRRSGGRMRRRRRGGGGGSGGGSSGGRRGGGGGGERQFERRLGQLRMHRRQTTDRGGGGESGGGGGRPDTRGMNGSLALWVRRCERQYRRYLDAVGTGVADDETLSGILPENRRIALEGVGFCRSMFDEPRAKPARNRRATWEERYEELEEYKAEVRTRSFAAALVVATNFIREEGALPYFEFEGHRRDQSSFGTKFPFFSRCPSL